MKKLISLLALSAILCTAGCAAPKEAATPSPSPGPTSFESYMAAEDKKLNDWMDGDAKIWDEYSAGKITFEEAQKRSDALYAQIYPEFASAAPSSNASAEEASSSDPAPSSATTDTTEPEGSTNPSLDEIKFQGDVYNDVTGNWRYSKTYAYDSIENYALDYYKKFFKSDAEIHAVINKNLNTSACVLVAYPGHLGVTIYEYVDGEEHDAKELFSGMKLVEYDIDMETGEMERLY